MIATAPSSPSLLTEHPARPAPFAFDPEDRAPQPRFTVDGSGRLERHLAQTCDRIAAGLRGLLPEKAIEAVLLGGGYGRGEGGVWRTSDGDRPYNDLEFYVFLRGSRHLNERIHGRALHVFGEILTPQAGMDVEFRIASLAELAASRISMFSYDLLCGHRTLIGDEASLESCAAHRDAACIPLSEATRLMMNRCSGLLFAQQRLAKSVFTPGDADFVARNIAKAQLGAGDAFLTAFGEYHWSARERHRRLERKFGAEMPEWLADLCHHHAAGVAFKLHPLRSSAGREELRDEHAEAVALCRQLWLWLEGRRLGRHFLSVQDYVTAEDPKSPEGVVARNALVNLKVLGPRATVTSNPLRHPRERVLAALPLLLWEDDALRRPSLLARIQRELRSTATDLTGLVAAYRAIWSHVN